MNSPRKIIITSLISLFSFIVLHSQQLPPNVLKDVSRLTSKEFMGRGFSYNGNLKAANYLSERYKEIGLNAFEDGYFQSFKFPMNLIIPVPILEINVNKMDLGDDFIPYPLSGSGIVSTDDPIIYASNGLILPDQNINDFKDLLINDAVVVINETLTDSIKNNKAISPDDISKNSRIKNAQDLGAKAVLIKVSNLVYGAPKSRFNIPVADIKREAVVAKIQNISLHISSRFDSVKSNNVIGYIRGSLYQDSTVVISAHYDHVSALSEDCYFPGANDNASGVAMILSLAEYFTNNPIKYKIVVAAFSGEEEGLWGSKYFTENPSIDLSKCKFMINLDMVASGNKSIMAVGGKDFTKQFEILSFINDSLNLGELGQRLNAPNSDHYPFTQKGVKAFFLYANKGTQPYHNIYDVPETLNWNSFSDIYELSRRFIEKL